jgi:hypothetical protein
LLDGCAAAASLITFDENRRLTLLSLVAAFPTRSPLLANRTMDVVVVGAGLAHGFQAPVSRRGAHQISMFLMKVAKGGVGRLAAKGGAMELHKGSRHIESP